MSILNGKWQRQPVRVETIVRYWSREKQPSMLERPELFVFRRRDGTRETTRSLTDPYCPVAKLQPYDRASDCFVELNATVW